MINIEHELYVFAMPDKTQPQGYVLRVEPYYFSDMGVLIGKTVVQDTFSISQEEVVGKLQEFLDKKEEKIKADTVKELEEVEEERAALLMLTYQPVTDS